VSEEPSMKITTAEGAGPDIFYLRTGDIRFQLLNSEYRVVFTISQNPSRITLGPDVTPEQAAQAFLLCLQMQEATNAR